MQSVGKSKTDFKIPFLDFNKYDQIIVSYKVVLNKYSFSSFLCQLIYVFYF